MILNNSVSESESTVSSHLNLPYHELFEKQTGSIVILSPDLKILGATNTFVSETGSSRQELINKNLFEALPQSVNGTDVFFDVLKNTIATAIETQKPQHISDLYRFDIPSPTKPGEFLERYWRFNFTPIVNEAGKVCFIMCERIMANMLYKTKLQVQEELTKKQNKKAINNNCVLRLNPLLRKVPMSVIILEGEDLVYADYNEASEQLFPEKPRIGLPLLTSFPELQGRPIIEKLKNCYKTGETFEDKELLIPVSREHGQPIEDFYWHFICQALFNDQQKVVGLLIFALDVSSNVILRKQAEQDVEALKKVNLLLENRVKAKAEELEKAYQATNMRIESYHNLFMQAPVGIAILKGSEHIIEFANPLIAQLVGRTLEDVLNKSVFEALPEVKGQGFEEVFADVFENGKTFEFKEIPATLERNGELESCYFHVLYTPLRNVDNEIEGILEVAYEVTQQVEARKKAEESVNKVLFMSNAMPQKVWTANPNGEVDYANKQFLEYCGLSMEEFAGWGWQHIIDPDFRESNIIAWEKAVATGEMFQIEHRLLNTTGEMRWHLTRATPHFNEAGEVTMWLGSSTDIHDHKLAEQSLQELTKKLKKANKAISKSNKELEEVNQQLTFTNSDLDNFIYTASHDLKAPVSNIERLMEELMLELPEESLHKAGVKEIASMMQDAVDRFKRTINNLTEVTQLQKDTADLINPVNLKSLTEEVLLDMQQLIRDTGATIKLDIDDCVIESFSEKNLRSILYNLLSNAIKYRHPERNAVIELSCEDDEDYTVLLVKDNGLGISAGNQPKLFNMFRRFHDHVEGSGIGLYMVKRILDNSNGKIEVESQEGVGTSFKVYFRK